MSTGQVLLYDIRTNKPFRIKDHMNELPIKDVEFLGDYVLSMDPSIVKIWNKEEVSHILIFFFNFPLNCNLFFFLFLREIYSLLLMQGI